MNSDHLHQRSITVIRQSHPGNPALDTAVSRAILEEVAAARLGETFRLYVPGRVVAFGRQDMVAEGYQRAVQACREEGFEAVERLAGGRAAVFHEGTLAFSWAIPTHDPLRDITGRFTEVDSIVMGALRCLGFDARVGEIPGEYCPGRYSVNLEGRIKVMGVGQRLRRGVAHVGGVVVVYGREPINRVLTPVYRELSFPWDPAATGSLRSVRKDISTTEVAESLLGELASRATVSDGKLGAETLRLAQRLLPEHLPLLRSSRVE
ncbi:MAG: lipoate--protein ligase family protein [bacterium]|nr:lipoate--protein ligase family protein [Acidimicrobiia bacterium]MCY4650344.1 lipoate--protein ligase family protein [bacterium]